MNDNDDDTPHPCQPGLPPAPGALPPLTAQDHAEWDLARTRYFAAEDGKPWPKAEHAAALLAKGKSVPEAVAALKLRSRLRVIPGGPG